MLMIKSGIAALGLVLLAATPATAQNHGMSGRTASQSRPMAHKMPMSHGMSRADTRMMARCHKMSHRMMMRNHSCMRLMAMEKRNHDMHGRRDHRM